MWAPYYGHVLVMKLRGSGQLPCCPTQGTTLATGSDFSHLPPGPGLFPFVVTPLAGCLEFLQLTALAILGISALKAPSLSPFTTDTRALEINAVQMTSHVFSFAHEMLHASSLEALIYSGIPARIFCTLNITAMEINMLVIC